MARRTPLNTPFTVTSEPAMTCPACQQAIDMECTWMVDKEDVPINTPQFLVVTSATLRLVKIAIHHVCSEYDSGT